MAFRLRRAELALALVASATACATATNDGTTDTETAGAAGMPKAGSAGSAAGASGALQAGAPSAGAAGARAGAGGTSGSSGGASGGSGGAATGGTAGKAGSGGTGGGGGTAGKGGTGAGGGSAGGPTAGAGGGTSCANATSKTLDSIYDAELNAEAPTANVAYVAEVRVVRGGTAGSHRAVFWFDFTQVPAGRTLKTATLQLTIANNPGLTKNLAVHRISQAANRKWEETQVTWSAFKSANAWTAPGGDFVATATGTQTIQAATLSGTTLSYNVLADAQSFYAAPATNYGWLIKDPLDSTNPSGESVYIATRENTTINKPVVVVTYCP